MKYLKKFNESSNSNSDDYNLIKSTFIDSKDDFPDIDISTYGSSKQYITDIQIVSSDDINKLFKNLISSKIHYLRSQGIESDIKVYYKMHNAGLKSYIVTDVDNIDLEVGISNHNYRVDIKFFR